MPEPSLFDACLLNPGNIFKTVHRRLCTCTWRKNIPNPSLSSYIKHCMREAPHYWHRAAQLSTVFPSQSWPSCRSGYPEAEAPIVQRTDEGKIWSSRSFMQLHTAAGQSTATHHPGAFIYVPLISHLRPLPPHCPLNGNVFFSSSEPSETAVMAVIRALVAWADRLDDGVQQHRGPEALWLGLADRSFAAIDFPSTPLRNHGCAAKVKMC